MAARILVVDDSQVTAKVTQAYLEAAGYQVKTVPDGQAALQAVEDQTPDLILLDVVLLNNPDSGLVSVFEDLAWRASDPQLRNSKPENPTPIWQHTAQRMRGREPQKK